MKTNRLSRYRNDPVAFVRDCFRWDAGDGPAAYQEEALVAVVSRKRVSLRGPHGLGKTAVAAWLVLWFALTRDAAGEDWKIPTTASAWRQLTKYLWPEIHKWTRRLRWDRLGRAPFDERLELQQINLKLGTGEAFAVASSKHELIEGAHADSLLYVFDEAKAIPSSTFDAAEGALSGSGGGEAFAFAGSTPGEPQGRFYEIQSRRPGYEDWWVRAVSRAELIESGRMDGAWAEQRRRQWGEKSAVYQNRVEGNFASSDEDSVIPLAWVEAAIERWHEWRDAGAVLPAFTALALDVADGGEDRSILAPRHGALVPEIRDVTQGDPHSTMALVGIVKGVLEAKKGYGVVDSIGVGAGVVSRCRELGLDIRPFNASEGTDLKDRSGELGFINKRAAGWWGMRERLHPETGDGIALPDDPELVGDLTAPHWSVTSTGRIKVESKDDIRRQLGRSTDKGDAVVMVHFELPALESSGASDVSGPRTAAAELDSYVYAPHEPGDWDI